MEPSFLLLPSGTGSVRGLDPGSRPSLPHGDSHDARDCPGAEDNRDRDERSVTPRRHAHDIDQADHADGGEYRALPLPDEAAVEEGHEDKQNAAKPEKKNWNRLVLD